MSEWKTVTDVTFESEGAEERSCVCGYVETRMVGKLTLTSSVNTENVKANVDVAQAPAATASNASTALEAISSSASNDALKDMIDVADEETVAKVEKIQEIVKEAKDVHVTFKPTAAPASDESNKKIEAALGDAKLEESVTLVALDLGVTMHVEGTTEKGETQSSDVALKEINHPMEFSITVPGLAEHEGEIIYIVHVKSDGAVEFITPKSTNYETGIVVFDAGSFSPYALQVTSTGEVVFYDGDKVLQSQKVSAGSTVEKPEAPAKEGYRFLGWFTADGKEFNFETRITTVEMKLYAKWEQLPVVDAGDEGGSGSGSGVDADAGSAVGGNDASAADGTVDKTDKADKSEAAIPQTGDAAPFAAAAFAGCALLALAGLIFARRRVN